jgi:RNA polymerase sigma-70 factor (ECF subfamily)
MPTSPKELALLGLLRSGPPTGRVAEAAARQLFDTYVHRLLPLARGHISQRLARRIDPEDVVQSVFRTFFQRIREGRLRLDEQDDLGKLLVGMTVRKALRQVAFHQADRRTPSLEVYRPASSGPEPPEFCAPEPSPDMVVAFVDQLEHFLDRLRPQDRPILEMRLQGYRNDEIAQHLGKSDRHVRRVLGHIRALAEEEDLGP